MQSTQFLGLSEQILTKYRSGYFMNPIQILLTFHSAISVQLNNRVEIIDQVKWSISEQRIDRDTEKITGCCSLIQIKFLCSYASITLTLVCFIARCTKFSHKCAHWSEKRHFITIIFANGC